MVAGIVCAAAITAYGVGWFLLPYFQASERTVEREASVQAERARRLLHRYDARLAYTVVLTDDLAEQGFELEPDVVSDDLADEYQEAHGRMWDAFHPVDWVGDDTRAARANYENLARQISEGIRGQNQLVEDNEELLDEALRAVQEALAITRGNASSRSHAEATRLKAVILYHQGTAERVRARLHRRTGDSYRRELIALAATATESDATRDLVASSNIDGEIARLFEQTAQIDALIADDEKALAEVEGRITELEDRLHAAGVRRTEADAARQQFMAAGIDFSDPFGPERFRERSETLDQAFRTADREGKQLLYGSYPNAEIDASQDYLSGQYVEAGSTTALTTRRGLVHERNDRVVLLATLEGLRGGAEDVRAEIGRLQTMRKTYQAAQTESITLLEKGAEEASEIYAELNRIDAEAFTMEDQALDLFEESAKAAEQAARFTDTWLREGSNRAVGSSPEMNPFAARGSNRWMKGYILAQAADARLAKAWVYHERHTAYTVNAEVLSIVAGILKPAEANGESEREKAAEARERGVEEVVLAMGTLDTAHGDSGRHWTLAAQAAGTTYLLALFGHQDYVADTIAAYRNAVQGRENDELARVFVSRLNRLEQR